MLFPQICLTSGLHSRKSLSQITLLASYSYSHHLCQVQKKKKRTQKSLHLLSCVLERSSLKQWKVLNQYCNRFLLEIIISSGQQWSLKKVFLLKCFQNHNSKSDKVLNPVSVRTGKLKLLSNLTFPICFWKCHQDLLIKERELQTYYLFPSARLEKLIFIQETGPQNKSSSLWPMCVGSTRVIPGNSSNVLKSKITTVTAQY